MISNIQKYINHCSWGFCWFSW